MKSPLSRRAFLRTTLLAGAGLAVTPALPGPTYSPIIMYHHVGDTPPGADAIRRDLTLPAERFAAHLDFLQSSGFHVITLARLWDGLNGQGVLPDRPVVITFDDGYDDAYSVAFPLLAARGMSGMFHLITGFVGQPGYLTWAQITTMSQAGMEFGNHTVSHPDLRRRSHAFLIAQIDGAASAIADTLGARPRFFCYPSGRYDKATIQAVRETGHAAATTVHDGTLHSAANPYLMRRVRIHSSTSAAGLKWLLSRSV